jgi:hypothetical protein
MEFVIDEELRSLIPPLSQKEYEQLEQNILEFGCLDALKVWPIPDSDEVILLDGHNRFKICREHNVNYDTESISLIDRAAAIDWMIANQLGRRNLSAEQVSYLRGRQYQQEKQEIPNPEGRNQRRDVEDEICPQHPKSTAARLAKHYGVSEGTIQRDAKYAKAVDAIVAVTAPEAQQQLLGINSNLTKSATLQLAELARTTPAAVPGILDEINQAANKTAASAIVRRFTSKSRETRTNKDKVRLTDFENATDAINWLKGKFTEAELAEALNVELV